MTTTNNTFATPADAELVLRLYDLRRESEMRNARNWFGHEFWPRTNAEAEQIAMSGSQQGRWLSQVVSYWDMAAALVVSGALHPGLFYDTCGEAWFTYAKIKPFVASTRAKFPDFVVNLEKAIEGSEQGRARLKGMEGMIAQFAASVEEKKKQQQRATGEAA